LSKKVKADGSSVNGRIFNIVKFLGLWYDTKKDTVLINNNWLPRMSLTRKMIQGIVWKNYSGNSVKWAGWKIHNNSYLISGYLEGSWISVTNLKNWLEIIKFWKKPAKGGLFIHEKLWVYDPAVVSTLACNDELPYLKTYLKLRQRRKKISKVSRVFLTKYGTYNSQYLISKQLDVWFDVDWIDAKYHISNPLIWADILIRNLWYTKFYPHINFINPSLTATENFQTYWKRSNVSFKDYWVREEWKYLIEGKEEFVPSNIRKSFGKASTEVKAIGFRNKPRNRPTFT